MNDTRRILTVLLALCILLLSTTLPFATSAVSAGYLAQLDFESATVGSAVTGWAGSNMVGENAATGSPAVLGGKVGKFTGAEFAGNYYNTAYSVTSGKTYEVTAWINHLSYTKGANETYVGASLGVFTAKSFSGATAVALDATQTVFNTDGTVAQPKLATPGGGKSYATISTAPAGSLAQGTWYKIIMTFTANVTSSDAYIILRCNYGQNVILFDNITFREIKQANITVNSKESAAVIPVGTTVVNVGDPFHFKVASLDQNPQVTVNGQTVTKNAEGVYSVMAEENMTINIVCDGDELLPEKGKDQLGNDLTKYDQSIYLKPVWEGDTVYHEAALFYTGRESVKLLYPISEIVSLRSYDLKTYYVEGVDYVIENGLIKRLPNSNIPVYTKGLTITDPSYNDGTPYKSFPTNTAGTEWAKFIDDKAFPATAIAVTYKHTTVWPDGFNITKPASQREKLSSFLQKLENGETVNIAIIGDSEACGWSSSGLNYPNSIYDDTNTEGNFKTNYVINVAPFAPTWMDMFVAELRVRYPNATINFKNLALGGKDAAWGAANLEARLALWDKTPDLFLIGFGGNDLTAGISPASYKTSTQTMINKVRSNIKNGNPNAEILLLAPKIANNRVVRYSVENTLPLEQQLIDLSNSLQNVAVAKTTSLFANVVKSKEAVDYLNTNINHGNDFFARLYTQNLLALLTADPVTTMKGDINNDNTVDLRDVTALSRHVAGWDIAVNEDASDVNDDNSVDLRDVTYLARHIAGWNGYSLD